MKTLVATALASTSVLAFAQAPNFTTYDALLFGNGQPWHHTTQVAPTPVVLENGTPSPVEKPIVEQAAEVLASSSAKALALVDGKRVVWVGYRPPATTDVRLFGFSMGKTITAAAVGKAICQKMLSLDTPAKQFVPELAQTDLGAVNVRDLLRMSSGTWQGNSDTTIWSPQQAAAIGTGNMNWVDLLATRKVSEAQTNLLGTKRKPGEEFDYGSTDPIVLGVMLNRSTGMTYAKWVEQEVLIPAGIASPAIIGQDKSQYGQADASVRMTMPDWIRFAVWLKESEKEPGCFGDFIRSAATEEIANRSKTSGHYFSGYGYFVWTGNSFAPDSYWALGYAGQRIAWNHHNDRMLIAFSSAENYMDRLYKLYAAWEGDH
jgi:CubicO group peptidase (beta-lactamase class C family)